MVPDELGLIFAAPVAAGDPLHSSIPIFKVVAGIETPGFPGTKAPAVLLCALAGKKSDL